MKNRINQSKIDNDAKNHHTLIIEKSQPNQL